MDESTKQKIISLIAALIPEAKIILYGSRARGDFTQWSDIDIALNTGNRLPVEKVDEVASVLRETNIPYKIEVVDFHQVPDAIRTSIEQEGIRL